MKRILIIDDHAIVRRGLRQLLGEAWPDAEIGEAGQLREATDRLADGRWDLVLLDINLPEGSGLELLPQARRLCAGTPVLVISAYPEAEFAKRALTLGAAGYLTKASLADEVLLAIGHVAAGGLYVSASLAVLLATELGAPPPVPPHELLSPRELEVLRRVANGVTIRQIADDMQLSEKTIATYRSRLADKLGLAGNVALTRYAVRHGLAE